jgi:hypothetical protein
LLLEVGVEEAQAGGVREVGQEDEDPKAVDRMSMVILYGILEAVPCRGKMFGEEGSLWRK